MTPLSRDSPSTSSSGRITGLRKERTSGIVQSPLYMNLVVTARTGISAGENQQLCRDLHIAQLPGVFFFSSDPFPNLKQNQIKEAIKKTTLQSRVLIFNKGEIWVESARVTPVVDRCLLDARCEENSQCLQKRHIKLLPHSVMSKYLRHLCLKWAFRKRMSSCQNLDAIKGYFVIFLSTHSSLISAFKMMQSYNACAQIDLFASGP